MFWAGWFFWSALVSALHADDQTSINKLSENPRDPSVEFVHVLRSPSTLLVGETAAMLESSAAVLKQLMSDAGHNVTQVSLDLTPKVQLRSGSNWIYDTIILFGNSLPKPTDSNYLSAPTLLDFLETAWTLPSGDLIRPYGLRLPPSVLVFSDASCSGSKEPCDSQSDCNSSVNEGLLQWLQGIGLQPTTKRLCSAVLSRSVSSADSSPLFDSNEMSGMKVHYGGGSHLYQPANPLVVPMLFSEQGSTSSSKKVSLTSSVSFQGEIAESLNRETPVQALVSGFQGERTWSRAAFSSSLNVCADSHNLDFCRRLLDWVTHRREVFTWSNLRHWRLHEKMEWSEYEGDTVRTSWQREELETLSMTRPFLYRIRDEIILGVDVWQITGDDSAGFAWKPLRTPWLKFEYNMMETYIRKLLLPASGAVSYPTNLMKAAQAANFTQLGEMTFNAATHWIHYKAPKQHGIFKMVLKSVGHAGRTSVWLESLMPLRTYKHDEDPRFVLAAFPFYSAVFISCLAFVLLTLLFPVLPPASDSHLKQQ